MRDGTLEENSTRANRSSPPNRSLLIGPILPRLGEFDLGGVLYHARYFHILEDAREALLRKIDLPYEGFVAQGQHLAVVESHQEFRKPIRYGEPIFVSIWVAERSRVGLKFQYEIRSEKQQLLHSAKTSHVFVETQADGFSLARIPVELSQKLLLFTADADMR